MDRDPHSSTPPGAGAGTSGYGAVPPPPGPVVGPPGAVPPPGHGGDAQAPGQADPRWDQADPRRGQADPRYEPAPAGYSPPQGQASGSPAPASPYDRSRTYESFDQFPQQAGQSDPQSTSFSVARMVLTTVLFAVPMCVALVFAWSRTGGFFWPAFPMFFVVMGLGGQIIRKFFGNDIDRRYRSEKRELKRVLRERRRR